jgi:hypothetical protein
MVDHFPCVAESNSSAAVRLCVNHSANVLSMKMGSAALRCLLSLAI